MSRTVYEPKRRFIVQVGTEWNAFGRMVSEWETRFAYNDIDEACCAADNLAEMYTNVRVVDTETNEGEK